MIHISHSQDIAQPVDRVFAFAADPENNPRWWTAVLDARLATDRPIRQGSRFRETGQGPLGKINSLFEVTQYEPEREVQFKVVEGPLPAQVTERFEALGDQTRLTVDVAVEPPGLLRLAQPLLRRMLDRNWQRNLATLKELLEA